MQMICESGKAGNDLDLRDARSMLSAEKDHPSNVDSSVPAKAFQRYASLFYRFREGTGIKGLCKRKQ